MSERCCSKEHSEVVNFLLKKSERKDPEPTKHVDNVDPAEIEELTKKIQERIKVDKC